MERIAMSQDERDDLHLLKRVEAGSMTQREAAEKMGVTARWVRKLVKRMKKEGDAVVVHGLRGRASNRKLSEDSESSVSDSEEPDWHDFGPTFAAERPELDRFKDRPMFLLALLTPDASMHLIWARHRNAVRA